MSDRPEQIAPSVRIIRGIWVQATRRRWRTFALGLLAILIFWLSTGLYTVGNGESAVLRRFGKISRTGVGPGLHLSFPSEIDRIDRFQTGKVFRLEVRGDATKKMSILTGDENVIDIGLVVQYKVTDLDLFLYRCDSPVEFVKETVRTSLLETISAMEVDDVLTSGKAAIQQQVRTGAQELLRKTRTGITLLAVTLRSVDPPREAAGAFRKVSDSRAESARLINNAESARENRLSLARASAVRSIESARADSTGRVLSARGTAKRFASLLTQYRREPVQTRIDLYREKVSAVIPRAEVILLAPGEIPRIDVQLRRGETPGR